MSENGVAAATRRDLVYAAWRRIHQAAHDAEHIATQLRAAADLVFRSFNDPAAEQDDKLAAADQLVDWAQRPMRYVVSDVGQSAAVWAIDAKPAGVLCQPIFDAIRAAVEYDPTATTEAAPL